MHHLKIEKIVRDGYNRTYSRNAKKTVLHLGKEGAKHEYDFYEKGKVIGGVSTSPWKNSTGSKNTGGQDRASAELLWLSLWNGKEKRIHVLTNKEMAERLYKRFSGTSFRKSIEIMHFNLKTKSFSSIGVLE